MNDPIPYWRRKGLAEMSQAEWERLCDGCGRCCLVKLEDADTGELFQTRLACRLLDTTSCRCGDYENRHARVDDCVRMSVDALETLAWLPETCAYAKIARGEDLDWWHPLVSGRDDTVHRAGASVRGFAISESLVHDDAYENFITEQIETPSRER